MFKTLVLVLIVATTATTAQILSDGFGHGLFQSPFGFGRNAELRAENQVLRDQLYQQQWANPVIVQPESVAVPTGGCPSCNKVGIRTGGTTGKPASIRQTQIQSSNGCESYTLSCTGADPNSYTAITFYVNNQVTGGVDGQGTATANILCNGAGQLTFTTPNGQTGVIDEAQCISN